MEKLAEEQEELSKNKAEENTKEKQEELIGLQTEVKNKTELNHAEINSAFGINVGEPISVLSLVNIVSTNPFC